MTINFNLIKSTFFTNETLNNHDIITKKGKTYEQVSKNHSNIHTHKIPLGKVLSSLFKEVKNNERTNEELQKALSISNYFVNKKNNEVKNTNFISSTFHKIKEIYQRFQNLITGNSYNTNLELALQIKNYLISKNIKLNEFPVIGGFKADNFWTCLSKNHPHSLDPIFNANPDFKIISENFEKFCENVNASKAIDYVKPPENPTISPIIHFIWLGSDLPSKINQIVDTWRTCHPGWTIKVWGDKDVEQFPWKNRSAFNEAINGKCWAEAADIWRYEILYNEGGIYSDTDVVCFKSFNDLIVNNVKFFAGQETNQVNPWMSQVHDYTHPLYLCNAIIGVAKNSPIMKFCIDNLKPRSQSKFPIDPKGDILSRTGPVLFSRACREGLQSSEKDKILVLPCSYLYPLPFFLDGRQKKMSREKICNDYLEPESLALHLWDASW